MKGKNVSFCIFSDTYSKKVVGLYAFKYCSENQEIQLSKKIITKPFSTHALFISVSTGLLHRPFAESRASASGKRNVRRRLSPSSGIQSSILSSPVSSVSSPARVRASPAPGSPPATVLLSIWIEIVSIEDFSRHLCHVWCYPVSRLKSSCLFCDSPRHRPSGPGQNMNMSEVRGGGNVPPSVRGA